MRKVSRVVEDEVLSDRRSNASPPPFSIVLLCRFSGEARAASRDARVLPAAPPSYSPSYADEQASASVRRPVRS